MTEDSIKTRRKRSAVRHQKSEKNKYWIPDQDRNDDHPSLFELWRASR